MKHPDVEASVDVGLPTAKETRKLMTAPELLLKATALSLLFVVILLIVTAIGLGIFAYTKVSAFLSASNLSFAEAKQLVENGISKPPPTINNKTTFLILGIDTVANKDAPPLTDTMLLMSIDYKTGEIRLLSLPRDLWSDNYRTKINALYYYGLEKYPGQPQRFPTEVVSEITGIPINYTVVFSLDSIAEIVDIVGGLEVDVPKSFVDTEFPRNDVDVTSTTDPILLYETIEFTAGTETMTADRVQKYIRSRHSEGDTGTDLDRSARQQLVITSLVKKITSRAVLTNPKTMAALYTWYSQRLSSFISTSDVISIAYALFPVRQNVVFVTNALPILPDDPKGVIEHLPIEETDNQWTYTIVEESAFKQNVKEAIF